MISFIHCSGTLGCWLCGVLFLDVQTTTPGRADLTIGDTVFSLSFVRAVLALVLFGVLFFSPFVSVSGESGVFILRIF